MGIRDVVSRTASYLVKRKTVGAGLPTVASDYGVGDVWGWIPSGITVLDYMTGGGLPIGRCSEVYSLRESEGKTTLLLHYVASLQRLGGVAVWLESEGALDKYRAERLGVDLDNLILWGPPTLEQGFAYIGEVLRTIGGDSDLQGAPVLIVWDTVGSAPTEAEKDGDSYGDGMSKAARVIREAMRDLTLELHRHRAHVCFVNQSFVDIKAASMPGASRRATQKTTPGGGGIKFHASLRLQLRRRAWIEKDDEKVGIVVQVKSEKNKLAPAYREIGLELHGANGYDEVGTLFSFLNGSPALSANGSWYTTAATTGEVGDDGNLVIDTVRAHGQEKLLALAHENPGIVSYWQAMAAHHWALPPDRMFDADGFVRPLEKYRQHAPAPERKPEPTPPAKKRAPSKRAQRTAPAKKAARKPRKASKQKK